MGVCVDSAVGGKATPTPTPDPTPGGSPDGRLGSGDAPLSDVHSSVVWRRRAHTEPVPSQTTVEVAPRPGLPSSGWRCTAQVRITQLRLPARSVNAGGLAAANVVHELLNQAQWAVDARRGPVSAWLGTAVETAWRNIHAAEVMLLRLGSARELTGRSSEIDALVTLCLPATDRRRIELNNKYMTKHKFVEEDRALVVGAVEAAYREYDDQRSRVRSFRNVLIVVGFIMLVSAVSLALVTAFFQPTPLSLCVDEACPTGRHQASAGDVAFVEVLGATSALLIGAISISRLRGTATPYALPVIVSIFKAPTGALSAVFGLILINAGFVPGIKPGTAAAIVGWALLFGASQQTFTTLIDRQAQTVLNNVASTEKNEKNTASQ